MRAPHTTTTHTTTATTDNDNRQRQQKPRKVSPLLHIRQEVFSNLLTIICDASHRVSTSSTVRVLDRITSTHNHESEDGFGENIKNRVADGFSIGRNHFSTLRNDPNNRVC